MSRFSGGAFIDAWATVFREGPCALLETLLDEVKPALDERTRTVVRLLVEHVADQTKWIVAQRADLEKEKARIREVGQMVRLAGLRSYTDEKGRIYVAPEQTERRGKR